MNVDYFMGRLKEFCAKYIQKWWRKQVGERQKETDLDSMDMSQTTKKKKKRLRNRNVAAVKIQRAWRRHIVSLFIK